MIFVQRVVERCRAEHRAEKVGFPSVEIYLELLYILESTKACNTVGGSEVIFIACNVANESEAQFVCYSPVDICLIVDEIRAVFSFCVECAQQIVVAFVTYGICDAYSVVSPAYVCARSEQARGYSAFEFAWFAVCDIKY